MWNRYEGFTDINVVPWFQKGRVPDTSRVRRDFWLCVICSRALGVWFPLTSFMGGRNSTTASLSHTLCFPLYSVGSSLTYLVEVGCDVVREATESHVWHQLFYLVSSPICPWLYLLPNLSKQPFEIIRILQGLGEKGDKEKERLLFSYLSTTFKWTSAAMFNWSKYRCYLCWL